MAFSVGEVLHFLLDMKMQACNCLTADRCLMILIIIIKFRGEQLNWPDLSCYFNVSIYAWTFHYGKFYSAFLALYTRLTLAVC